MLQLILLITLAFRVNGNTIKDQPTSIINGDEANIEDYPYYAYLFYRTTLHCGAVIIAPDILLTAAHCLDGTNFTVYVGITTEDDLKSAEAYQVMNVSRNPEYTWKAAHDVGVIKLTRNLTFSEKVQPIELTIEPPPVNGSVSMVGFGKVKCGIDTSDWGWKPCPASPSTHLRSAIMTVVRVGPLGTIYTKNDSQNTCHGDSGGPVVYENTLVALVSTGEETLYCTGLSIQAPIVPWLSWIQEQIDSF